MIPATKPLLGELWHRSAASVVVFQARVGFCFLLGALVRAPPLESPDGASAIVGRIDFEAAGSHVTIFLDQGNSYPVVPMEHAFCLPHA